MIQEVKPPELKILKNNLLDAKSQKIIEENENLDSNPPQPIELSRKMRWIVFIILVYMPIVMELDQGVLSSTTDDLSKDMNLTDKQLGGLGSMIFLGKSLGCLIFFSLINKLNRKYMLLVTSFLTLLGLILTTQTRNLILLYICRVIVGLATSFMGIYVPVWIDQFGIHKHKSIFLSVHHISSSLGNLFGYVMGIWLGWELSFYIQSIILVFPVIILFFINNKYFSMSLMPIKSKLKLTEKDKEPKNKNDKAVDKLEKEIKKIKVTVLDESFEEENNEEKKEDNKEENIEENKKENNEEIKENNNNTDKENINNEETGKEEEVDIADDISLFEDIQQQGENMSRGSILRQIKAIVKSPLFILINVLLFAIYAIVAAIQFWINDYLQYGLRIENPQTRLLMFGSCIITSPPLGMIIGGVILSKIGGYESERAIYIPLFASLVVTIFANLAPLSDNAYIFLPLFWIYFFAGSAIIPVANGILLVSVDKQYTGAASSISILLYNVLGRFPGPNLYAFFKSLINDDYSRKPMWMLLNVSVVGFLAVLIALKFNKKKFQKLREELLKKEQEKNNEKNVNNNDIDNEGEKLIVNSGEKENENNNNENINEKGENEIKEKEKENIVIENNEEKDNDIDDNNKKENLINDENNKNEENIDENNDEDKKIKNEEENITE